jgi:hypothetical protein
MHPAYTQHTRLLVLQGNHGCKVSTVTQYCINVLGLTCVRAGFLSRFEGASCPAKLLEEITIIDTPGVLSGEKQRIERNYNVSTCTAAMPAAGRGLCCVLQ